MHIALTRLGAGVGVLTLTAALAACSSSGKAKSSAPAGPTSSAAAASQPAAASSEASSSSAAPSSEAAAGGSVSSLLIPASDIPIPGFTRTTPTGTQQGKGASAAYVQASAKRTIGDTIVVLGSSAQAKTAAMASVSAAKAQITSAQVSSAPIGDGGTAIRGTASTGEVAALVWTEGRALIVLEFESPTGDPVPTSVIQTVAMKQDAKVKAGLPG